MVVDALKRSILIYAEKGLNPKTLLELTNDLESSNTKLFFSEHLLTLLLNKYFPNCYSGALTVIKEIYEKDEEVMTYRFLLSLT